MKKDTEQYLLIGGGLLAAYFLFFSKNTTTPVLSTAASPVLALPAGSVLPAGSSAVTTVEAAVPALTNLWSNLFPAGSSSITQPTASSLVDDTGSGNGTDYTLPSSTDCFTGDCGSNASFLAGIGVIA